MSKYTGILNESMQTTASDAIYALGSYNLMDYCSIIDSCEFQGKTNIKDALSKIISGGSNGSFTTLKKQLANLKTVASDVKKIKDYEAKINELKPQLTYTDDEGKTHTRWWIKLQIESKNNDISALEKEIDGLLS